MTPKQHGMFINAMQAPYQLNGSAILTTTGNTVAEYDREYEVEKVVKQHSKSYYYVLSVSDVDDVFFKIYRGNKVAWWLHKTFGAVPSNAEDIGGDDWNTVRKRTHLPATLGAAHKDIDDAIAEHKEVVEHDKYVAELLETEPENLKMIGDLEKLQEGEPEDEPGHAQYSSNIAFSGNAVMQANPGSLFYIAPQADPELLVDGDVNIDGTLTIGGQTIEEKMTHYIADAIRDNTDKMMMEILEDGKPKESAGPSAQ